MQQRSLHQFAEVAQPCWTGFAPDWPGGIRMASTASLAVISNSKMTRSWILLLLAPQVFAVGPFSDPAPPAVQTLTPMQALAPKNNPEVRFHSKPKPLSPGAVVED